MMVESEDSPFRRPGFVLAAGFLAIVVCFAIVAVFKSGSGSSAKEPPTGSSDTSPAAVAGGCNPTGTDQTIPTVAPKGVTWSLFHGVALPASSADGPLITEGDVARCYAHTPAGALIAASQISVRFGLSDDWREVTARQVEAGPAREAYVKLRARITVPPADGGGFGQMAGFKFITYTPQTAVIEVVLRGPEGTMRASVFTVVWDGGDWKIHLLSNGSLTNTQQDVTSLDGYAAWAGI
jgi:hypothetical protein